MTEKKTTLPSLRKEDWKKVKVETEKINKLLIYISTDNITELNELIYAEAKLVYDKIGVLQRNTDPVGRGCRIHRLHLCRGIRLPQ